MFDGIRGSNRNVNNLVTSKRLSSARGFYVFHVGEKVTDGTVFRALGAAVQNAPGGQVQASHVEEAPSLAKSGQKAYILGVNEDKTNEAKIHTLKNSILSRISDRKWGSIEFYAKDPR